MPKLTWSDYSNGALRGPSVYRWRPCHRCGKEQEDDKMERHLAGCQLSFRIDPTMPSSYEHYWRDQRYGARMYRGFWGITQS